MKIRHDKCMCTDNTEAARKLTVRDSRNELLLERWKRSQERVEAFTGTLTAVFLPKVVAILITQ